MKIKRYLSIFKLSVNYSRAIHSIKTAVACIIGVALEEYYGWPKGQWIPITVMVVMSGQTHFGGALNKSFMRFLGTIGGLAIVLTVLWLFGNNVYVLFGTIFFASIMFTYIASSHGDISYAGTLGGVTVILILTSEQLGIEGAIQRVCYIVIGIVIALLASRFIFPIHARDRFRYHVAKTLRNLCKLYSEAVQLGECEDPEKLVDSELNAKIIADISTQPRLIYEAVLGSRVFASKKFIFNAVVNSEQNLSRLISLMHLSLCEAKFDSAIKEQMAAVATLHNIIIDDLNYLADCFEFDEQPGQVVDLDTAIFSVSQAVEKLPKKDNAQQLIAEHSFLFFMEQIFKELQNLRGLVVKADSKNSSSMI